jgi:putative endonuclease
MSTIELYYVYVLRSLRDDKFYVGYTHDLLQRVRAHNDGLVASTRHRTPLELVYCEGCLNQQDATSREKYLKTAWGKRVREEPNQDISRG